MAKAMLLRNTYRDSIELMCCAAEMERLPGVLQAGVVMGTAENLSILRAGPLASALAADDEPAPADLILAVKGDSEANVAAALEAARDMLQSTKTTGGSEGPAAVPVTSVVTHLSNHPDTNLLMLSTPGPYAFAEATKALKAGANVFMFSDNVAIEDEVALKQDALRRGLLMMGPDCGTAVIDGSPLGFANVLDAASAADAPATQVGLVGSSGTGLQEVSCLIDRLGVGVSHVGGVGGRDLSAEVGGAMTLEGIRRLEADPATAVIVVVSKAPEGTAADRVYEAVRRCAKPVVLNFMGMPLDQMRAKAPADVHVSSNLEAAAVLAVALNRSAASADGVAALLHQLDAVGTSAAAIAPPAAGGGPVLGLFSGGTLCKEAALVLKAAGVQHTVLDLGDDQYTVGRPHPMIDPSLRNQMAAEAAGVSVVLADVVLGHGSHADPAGELVQAVAACRAAHGGASEAPVFVASVTGTEADPQVLSHQLAKLQSAGIHVASTNAAAARLASELASGRWGAAAASDVAAVAEQIAAGLGARLDVTAAAEGGASAAPLLMMGREVAAVNVGLKTVCDGLAAAGRATHLSEWVPPCSGDVQLGRLLAVAGDDVAEGSAGAATRAANEQAIARQQEARPFVVGVRPAHEVLPGMANGRKLITHAGPPIAWADMCDPMRGAVCGAIVYEGWAPSLAEAEDLAASGEVAFEPCHHQGAVGPMAGIMSPSMPVFEVVNEAAGNKAYSTLNEGLGKVLRFGANTPDVIDRLRFLQEQVGPSLDAALQRVGPINLRALQSQALHMGDELHNRNTAASALFFQLLACEVDTTDAGRATLGFVRDNPHFFLNLSMAACKSAMDAAHGVDGSTVVTVMARNGVEIGIRVSGAGDRWFTAPASVIDGLFFPGYGPEDAQGDLGDSAICETAGLGGFVMAAAPAITRFVGGTVATAVQATQRMGQITLASSSDMQIPGLDFAGAPMAIDARKVCETGITPIINTGIAHKRAGVGQVGAGICDAPIAPFQAALRHMFPAERDASAELREADGH